MSNDEKHAGHPGVHIRSVIAQNRLNVTQAADALGVGRPALSNLLNGNSNLSSEMAGRLERAFGMNAGNLLEMQSAYDAMNIPEASMSGNVRTFAPPFAAPKADDIASWANGVESRHKFAALLRRLIHSTCDGLSKVDFPAHDDAERPGWDGEVESEMGNSWVPKGSSGWELGTAKGIEKKANADYIKRVSKLPEELRMETTFVFVTPRRWRDIKEWESKKAAKSEWKNVRAFDASDLEQWMEQSIPAQVWFANERGVQHQGTMSLDRCWMRWKADCVPNFTTNIFDEASTIAEKKLLEHFCGCERSLLRLACDSKLEGLAFIHSMLNADDLELANIRNRIVVFNEVGPLTQLANGDSRFIPIVMNRDVEKELGETGAGLGGVSIVSQTMVNSEAHIVLEPLSRDAFHNALEAMGLKQDQIKKYENESGRSLTVLRRRFSRNQAIRSPHWGNEESVARALIPFVFAGAWDKNNETDCKILSALAKSKPYEELECEIPALCSMDEDAPLWMIKGYRGVVSKIDALYAIQKWVTKEDILRYFDVMKEVLLGTSVDFEKGKSFATKISWDKEKLSSALRNGLTDSIILLAVHGNNLFETSVDVDTENLASKLVNELFEKTCGTKLEPIANELPALAEAAPVAFLSAIETYMDSEPPAMKKLVEPIAESSFSWALSSGLRRAMEILAWSPQFFRQVVLLLGRIAEMEKDDPYANTAVRSLKSIFRCWMPQTAVPVEMRISVFDQLKELYPDVAWKICCEQYLLGSSAGDYSAKPKWRDYAIGYGEVTEDKDTVKFRSHCRELALNWQPMGRIKLFDLINRLDSLNRNDRERVWEHVRKWAKGKGAKDRASMQDKIRESVSRIVRGLSREGISSLEYHTEIGEVKAIYNELEPRDIVWKHAWLFLRSSVEHFWDEAFNDDFDIKKRDKQLQEKRKSAIKEIFSEFGSAGLLRLASAAGNWGLVGEISGNAISSDESALDLISNVNNQCDIMSSENHRNILRGFFRTVGAARALKFIDNLCDDLEPNQLAGLLALCPFEQDVWDVLENSGQSVSDAYWSFVSPFWNLPSDYARTYATRKLNLAGRSLTALRWVEIDMEKTESDSLYDILQELPNFPEIKAKLNFDDRQAIDRAFKILNSRGEISRERMIAVEITHLGAFDQTMGNIFNLEAKMNDNPMLFCDAISDAYKRDEDTDNVEQLTEEQELAERRAYRFLSSLSMVPGRDDNGNIQTGKLKLWIRNARHLAEESGHRISTDILIGKMLTNAPAAIDGVWPCVAVRDAVNELYSKELAQGIITGLYNRRGPYFAGSGGTPEHELAKMYEKWAQNCEIEHPHMSIVLRDLAKRYRNEAVRYDFEEKIQRRINL